VTNTQQSDLGNYLTLRHEDDTCTGYCHLREPSPLAVGTRVRRGEVIGHLGRTGAATGPHLHWMHSRPGNAALSRALGFLDPLASVVADVEGAAVPPRPVDQLLSYTIQPGDTLFTLAELWGCTVTDIAALNGIVNHDQIFAGQTLLIPTTMTPA
jgi:murein DD-endopeptidase MepM/ murein hydrolase activator NlpD